MDCVLCKKPVRGIGFVLEPVDMDRLGFERLPEPITPDGLHLECRARIKRGVNAKRVIEGKEKRKG